MRSAGGEWGDREGAGAVRKVAGAHPAREGAVSLHQEEEEEEEEEEEGGSTMVL